MRILGIDWGEKRVGVAVADTAAPLAVPRATLKQNRRLISAIKALAKEERAEHIIIGLPLTMEGKESDMAKRVRAFGVKLEQITELPVHFVDERLTSKQVRRDPSGKGEGRLGRRRGGRTSNIDAVAAAAVLQSWLDRKDHET